MRDPYDIHLDNACDLIKVRLARSAGGRNGISPQSMTQRVAGQGFNRRDVDAAVERMVAEGAVVLFKGLLFPAPKG